MEKCNECGLDLSLVGRSHNCRGNRVKPVDTRRDPNDGEVGGADKAVRDKPAKPYGGDGQVEGAVEQIRAEVQQTGTGQTVRNNRYRATPAGREKYNAYMREYRNRKIRV